MAWSSNGRLRGTPPAVLGQMPQPRRVAPHPSAPAPELQRAWDVGGEDPEDHPPRSAPEAEDAASGG